MKVRTPMARVDLRFFLCSFRITTTLKNNQRNPEVAHPECIPPRCCNTDVHARRNFNGGHLRSYWELGSKEKENRKHTFAKDAFTNRYRNRPKSSFRTRIAVSTFPKTNALVYLCAYVPAPEIVTISIIIFQVTIKVKNFLREKKRMLHSWSRMHMVEKFLWSPVCIKPKPKLNPLTWSAFQRLSWRRKLRLNFDKFRHRTRRYRRKRLLP